MSSLTTSKAWSALQDHFDRIKNFSLRDAFEQDAQRHNKFSVNFDDILFDYSKNRINEETLPLLIGLAEHAQVEAKN